MKIVLSPPKGKLSKPCEFGVKLRGDMSTNGYITNHKLYLGNRADVGMLAESVKGHTKVFKDKFKGEAADRSLYVKDLIKNLEEEYKIALSMPHEKDRGRRMTSYKDKLYNRRSAIEAKISEGKRMCGWDKSLYQV